MGKLSTRLSRELTLYVRQLAWLHATPKPDERTKRAKVETEERRLSRLDQMKKERVPLRMPPTSASYIIDRLIEIGLTEAAGMGAGPLSWQSIAAWQSVTGIYLPAWEARLIRKLSVEYLAYGRTAEAEHCPPPWRGELTQAERDAEVRALRAVLD